jgi:D-beta-D-heptose 7-phosphate kinase/D-beta-D-heptose 1-phosphate adenosyltransferase
MAGRESDVNESKKWLSIESMVEAAEAHRAAGECIVFTNGCFDLLHAGHVRYLTAARAEGDLLVVGLNSDASVKRIKAPGRPVVPENQRAEVLSALACVDYVILFDEPDPGNLIRQIAPDVLVKGADWSEDRIIGADAVKARGGKVVRVPLVPEVSTSALIRRIIDRFC